MYLTSDIHWCVRPDDKITARVADESVFVNIEDKRIRLCISGTIEEVRGAMGRIYDAVGQAWWNRPRNDQGADDTLDAMHHALIGGRTREATEKPSEVTELPAD